MQKRKKHAQNYNMNYAVGRLTQRPENLLAPEPYSKFDTSTKRPSREREQIRRVCLRDQKALRAPRNRAYRRFVGRKCEFSLFVARPSIHRGTSSSQCLWWP